MRYSGTEYLKTAEEMSQLFRDHLADEVITNDATTTLSCRESRAYQIMGEPHILTTLPAGHTADTYLEGGYLGLLERFNRKSRAEVEPIYKERLDYELK